MEPTALFGVTLAGPLWLLLWAGFVVLTLVTWGKIVTKAGYSGWWLLVPVSAVVLWLAALAIGLGSLATMIRSGDVFGSGDGLVTPGRFDSAGLDLAGVLLILAFILFVVSWILFFVFGFSDWPALRPRSRDQAFPVVGGPDPLPFAPGPGTPAGWYPVGTNSNDQAYWDGQAWTARKKWEGAGWVDVPLVGSRAL